MQGSRESKIPDIQGHDFQIFNSGHLRLFRSDVVDFLKLTREILFVYVI